MIDPLKFGTFYSRSNQSLKKHSHTIYFPHFEVQAVFFLQFSTLSLWFHISFAFWLLSIPIFIHSPLISMNLNSISACVQLTGKLADEFLGGRQRSFCPSTVLWNCLSRVILKLMQIARPSGLAICISLSMMSTTSLLTWLASQFSSHYVLEKHSFSCAGPKASWTNPTPLHGDFWLYLRAIQASLSEGRIFMKEGVWRVILGVYLKEQSQTAGHFCMHLTMRGDGAPKKPSEPSSWAIGELHCQHWSWTICHLCIP